MKRYALLKGKRSYKTVSQITRVFTCEGWQGRFMKSFGVKGRKCLKMYTS